MSAEQSSYTIAVGGRDSLILNNSIEVTGDQTGLFLSDGRTPEGGEPDPDLGAATGSRVLNNTITIPETAETEPWGAASLPMLIRQLFGTIRSFQMMIQPSQSARLATVQ